MTEICDDDLKPQQDPQRKRHRRPRNFEIREEPVGVWLVIRYDEADSGARPIPNGEVYWTSPDIWITGGDALGNAIAGKPTSVHARIWNFGTFAAVPVRVDFHVVAPSIGIPWNAPKLIGTAWVNVQPLATAVADCPTPWVPADTGLSHACLIATCSSPLMDPADQPGNPRTDRKTGQRNVTVVQAAAGARMEFEFEFARTLGTQGFVDLAAMMTFGDATNNRIATDTASLTRTLRHLIATSNTPNAPTVARRALALHLNQAEPTRVRRLAAKELECLIDVKPHAKGARNPRLQMVDPDLGDAILAVSSNLVVEPLTPTKLAVNIQVPEGHGTVNLHLFQIEDGNVTGGHTIIFNQSK